MKTTPKGAETSLLHVPSSPCEPIQVSAPTLSSSIVNGRGDCPSKQPQKEGNPLSTPSAPILSSSMIDTYFICPMRYHYKYIEGLEPIIEAPELMFGKLWHIGMEAYHTGKNLIKCQEIMCEEWDRQVQEIVDSGAQVWDEDKVRWREMLELAIGMLAHYQEWESAQENYGEVVDTEYEFSVPLIDHDYEIDFEDGRYFYRHKVETLAIFKGKIDLITKDKNGYWLWDHKTTSSFDDRWEIQNHLNRQFRRYAWAYQELTGTPILGFIVNGARKKLPVVPEVLKKGGLSVRKNMDTTAEVYRRAIKENGLDEADYTGLLEALEAKGNTFFKRDVIYFNEEEISEAGRELYYIYLHLHSGMPPVKAPGPLCTRFRPCPYRSLCVEDTPEARMMFKERGKS